MNGRGVPSGGKAFLFDRRLHGVRCGFCCRLRDGCRFPAAEQAGDPARKILEDTRIFLRSRNLGFVHHLDEGFLGSIGLSLLGVE